MGSLDLKLVIKINNFLISNVASLMTSPDYLGTSKTHYQDFGLTCGLYQALFKYKKFKNYDRYF